VYQLKFAPDTWDDVKNATEYYNRQQSGLGAKFRKEVSIQISAIKHNPYTRSVRYDNVRLAVIEKFPYSIHYTINDKIVVVHAILCDYRNPDAYWVR